MSRKRRFHVLIDPTFQTDWNWWNIFKSYKTSENKKKTEISGKTNPSENKII